MAVTYDKSLRFSPSPKACKQNRVNSPISSILSKQRLSLYPIIWNTHIYKTNAMLHFIAPKILSFIKGLSLFGVGNIHADSKEQNLSLVSVGIF